MSFLLATFARGKGTLESRTGFHCKFPLASSSEFVSAGRPTTPEIQTCQVPVHIHRLNDEVRPLLPFSSSRLLRKLTRLKSHVLPCSGNDEKPNAAFLGDLAARIGAGPPKKPVGLVKKKEIGVEDVPDANKKDPRAAGGLGGLAAAVAGAASEATTGDVSAPSGADKPAK